MQTPNMLAWICATAAPLAMVHSGGLKKLPGWLSGVFSATWLRRLRHKKPPSLDELFSEPPADVVGPSGRIDHGGDAQSLVEEMLTHSRYALLLRPQLIGNLTNDQLVRARTALSEGMCLVPGGDVLVRRTTGSGDADAEPHGHEDVSVRVDGYFLDRYPVTNAQYYQFVRHGGYEQMAIWDPEVWPAVLDFVDQTGHAGPRFWRRGRYQRGEDRHPVVGVSWYEASAYARWAGKRLPTDAEWVKSGSWPVALPGHPLLQRRYPWGEAVDRSRANLWGSGPGRTVAVEEFPSGVSVGGVQQLIGNVWEWTADRLVLDDEANDHSAPPRQKLKSLRGGAFDTYLDNQATCHFQSGDDMLARKHNIGFRLAISLCDLPLPDASDDLSSEETREPSLEETHA